MKLTGLILALALAAPVVAYAGGPKPDENRTLDAVICLSAGVVAEKRGVLDSGVLKVFNASRNAAYATVLRSVGGDKRSADAMLDGAANQIELSMDPRGPTDAATQLMRAVAVRTANAIVAGACTLSGQAV